MQESLIISLIAGGFAGFTVDVTLFPLDTLKTRLQSQNGFWKSGGFNALYRGLGPTIIGSVPNAALFFGAYNTVKSLVLPQTSEEFYPLVHMGAACVAELVSCIVKVPTEIFKQRQQTSLRNTTSLEMGYQIHAKEGWRGFYRGYISTVLREIPFSIVQFPLWEYFKILLKSVKETELNPAEKAFCGAIAGCVAAAVTTPLDVAKTRIMLTENELKFPSDYTDLKVSRVLSRIYAQEGPRGLFAGILPRISWITIGGLIFFGSYEGVVDFVRNLETV